jgi:hypothetical protein
MHEMLKEYEGKHRGEPLFILGCGPSLEDYDLSKIDQYPSIGVNRSFKLYKPTYLMFIDAPIVSELEDINNGPQLLCWDMGIKNSKLPKAKKVREVAKTFRQCRYTRTKIDRKYDGLIFGNTTTHAALHLAYIMEADPIVLLGVDLRFRGSKYHFYEAESAANKVLVRANRRMVRNSPREKPKVEKQIKGELMLIRNEALKMKTNLDSTSRLFREKGTSVYYCYKRSALEGAEYKSFDDVLKEIEGEDEEV